MATCWDTPKEIWDKKVGKWWFRKSELHKHLGPLSQIIERKIWSEPPHIAGISRLCQLMPTLTFGSKLCSHFPDEDTNVRRKRLCNLSMVLQWVTEASSVQAQVSLSTKIILSHSPTKHPDWFNFKDSRYKHNNYRWPWLNAPNSG